MVNEITQLDSFTVHDSKIFIGAPNIDSDKFRLTINNLLPGKYHVLKHVSSDDGDTRHGVLYLLHSNFADKKDIEQYDWQVSQSKIYGSSNLVAMMNVSLSSSQEQDKIINNILSDNMVQVIDNAVCFSIVKKSTLRNYDVIKHNESIVGIKIDNIGAYINTPNRQLVKACEDGNLQQVRNLLIHPDKSQRADITYDMYAALNASIEYAFIKEDVTVMQYLLMSDEITEHADIKSSPSHYLFRLLYDFNIANKLISALPINIVQSIDEMYEQYFSANSQNEKLKHALKARLFAEQLNNELPKHNIISRKPKI